MHARLFRAMLLIVAVVGPTDARAQPSFRRGRIASAGSGFDFADLFLASSKSFFREADLEPQLIQRSKRSRSKVWQVLFSSWSKISL